MPDDPSTTVNGPRVQVASARPADMGRGLARISKAVLDELGLGDGAPIEIHGQRATAATAAPLPPEDEGLRVIRLDGLQRANAGVASGDFVHIAKPDVKAATKVTFAPAQKNIVLHGPGEALRDIFLDRPLVARDVVSTSVYRRLPTGAPSAPMQSQFSYANRRSYGLQEIRLIVTDTKPKGVVRITAETEIELLPQYTEPKESRAADVTYDDVGGLGGTIDQLREMIELPLRHPELFQRLGIEPPKGVLLHGPPGTGKTLLARAVANEAEATFLHIAGPEIMGSRYGESEQRLRDMFEQAQQEAPAIIFVDEIDSIAPKRRESGEVERRVVAQLLTLMDGLEPRQNVVVVGATNRVDALEEALRRPGRFDREIVIGVPDQKSRSEILHIHTRGMPLTDDVNIEEIARASYGFVGADLAALAREAAMEVLRRLLPEMEFKGGDLEQSVLDKLVVTGDDFAAAMRRVQPSAMREIMIQAPDVSWEDVGGLEETRRRLHEGIELPLRDPEAFHRVGIRPAKGFLLFGPPGTGKTLMAKAVAREAEANFVSAKSSDLLSKWYGESEAQISRLFTRARQVAPTIIFFDEIDSLAPLRGGGLAESSVTERVVNTLLSEMDGLEELHGIVVIGATNRPTLIDPALLRPGRFDELLYVPVPDRVARRRILGIQTKTMPLDGAVDLDSLAERTNRYTGADLGDLVRRAGLLALREASATVTSDHFESALSESRPSVTPEMEREYESMLETLKQETPAKQRIGFATTGDAGG